MFHNHRLLMSIALGSALCGATPILADDVGYGASADGVVYYSRPHPSVPFKVYLPSGITSPNYSNWFQSTNGGNTPKRRRCWVSAGGDQETISCWTYGATLNLR
jgi:hypothetical protein